MKDEQIEKLLCEKGDEFIDGLMVGLVEGMKIANGGEFHGK